MRLLLSRKGGGQGGEQVSWTESGNRNSSSSNGSSAGASQDVKLSRCPNASYGVDLDRIDSRLNVNICVGVARGEGKQRSKQTKRRTERETEREGKKERSMRSNMNDLGSIKGHRTTTAVGVRRVKGEAGEVEWSGGGTSRSSCHCVGALQLKC